MLFNPSRDEARQFFITVWKKNITNQPLAHIEHMTLAILLDHPEYQCYLTEDRIGHDWIPEHHATNPFLHIGMHLAIAEQLSIDQPAGICGVFAAFCKKLDDTHAAQHELMEGLGEMIWQAQRYKTVPDPLIYLEILHNKLK